MPEVSPLDLKSFFLKQKEAIYQGTRAVFARVPPDALQWRPAEGMLTLGEIARHVWMSEEGVRRLALQGDWGYHERRIPLGLEGILGEVASMEDETAQLARVHADTLREVEAFPLERFHEERVNDALGMRRRVDVLLYGINEHQIHHRAQIALHVRVLTGERASPYPL